MRDTEFYEQVLGLSHPWNVQQIDLDLEGGFVRLQLEHEPGTCWECPECGRELSCYDHSAQRQWRHHDTCQLKTYLHARLPRVLCPEHGVRQVAAPWAEPRGRFTLLFERFAIDVLQATQTVKNACSLLRVSWDELWGILCRAVSRGKARKECRPIRYLGVDEKAFRKGHSYLTVVCDIEEGTVEFVSEGRKKESLTQYFDALDPEQLQALKGIAMDMWEPYIQATRESVPLADSKIVFDRFHIMQHISKAVDTVRKQEHRLFKAVGDETLTKTKYLWLYSEENVPPHRREEFETLKSLELKASRAWAIKECLRHLWDYRSTGWARKFFKNWFHWATHSRLQPVRKAAHTLKRHLENILTYCRHPITNAASEGLNSKIMSLKRKAGGYRNIEHFKTAIYFHCGKLDMYPR